MALAAINFAERKSAKHLLKPVESQAGIRKSEFILPAR
jgi:hypothetical protein